MIDKKRRKLVTTAAATTVAIPVTAVIGTMPSYAAEMVDEASAAAKNWEYVATSENPDNMCNNCALYQGDSDASSGPCPLFQGQEVASEGWCKAWAAKPQ